MDTILHTIATFLSLYFLIKGAEWLMKGAVAIAEKLKISKLAIASTLIAFGTGLPTIAVNLALIFINKNGANVAIGSALGTNYVNIGLALGVPAFLTTIITKYSVFEKEIPIYLAITSLFTAFALDGEIEIMEGLVLLISYFFTLFIIYQYSVREKQKVVDTKELDIDTSTVNTIKTDGLSVAKSVFYIFLGLTLLILFSLFLSYLSPLLSADYNISEYVLGLTVIGIGTSLPTIFTSIRAAKMGYVDIVLGNVFGGSIANIALAIGLPAIFGTICFSKEAVSDTYYLSIFNMIVLFFILIEMKLLGKNGSLSRVSGIVIVGIYLVYLFSKLFL